ncbi:potassium voltage-gated channel subfamily KQT member 4 isoform X1 [Hydra vulgaris]|uniref:potassium voltage-gated channel subfamily KQT member 4 isoform X1 n=3 Tax=Hydra vulgaris TaxID=6087 RepID=UPI001F5E47D1|nr:potassium voltage-gated channel subfamily KQT member 4 isoform X1 [Hydra vulgaris]
MDKKYPEEENLLLYGSSTNTPQKEKCDSLPEKIINEMKQQRKRKRLRSIRLFKVKLFNLLERPRTKFAVLYHTSVFVLVLASLILSVLVTIDNYKANLLIIYGLNRLEISLVIIFSIEYFCRLWSCSAHVHYTGFWGRFRFIRKPYMVIDLIVIAAAIAVVPVVAPSTIGSGTELYNNSLFRFLHFLQVLRILRLDRQSGAFKMVSHVVFEHKNELMTCWYLSFILLVGCSFLVYLAEKSDPTESSNKIKNLGEGLYFGMITLLTVGYGDFSPNNWVAKIVTVVFAFIGTAFFALPAGILGSGFALQVAQNKKQKHFNRRLFPAAMVIQYAWRSYSAENWSSKVWNKYKFIIERPHSNFVRNNLHVTASLDTHKSNIFQRKKRNFGERNMLFNSVMHRHTVDNQPSNVDLRERYHSEGNLSYPNLDSLDHNQATIISLPPTINPKIPNEFSKLQRQSIDVLPSTQPITRPLNKVERNGVRFLLKVQLKAALRKFKVVRRPYDIKDVIEQYTSGQIEMFGFIRKFQTRVETALGIKGEKYSVASLDSRLTTVERKIDSINMKVDSIIDILGSKGFNIRKTSRCATFSETSTCAVRKLTDLNEKSFEQEAFDSVCSNKDSSDVKEGRLRSESRFIITPVFPAPINVDDESVFAENEEVLCKNKITERLSLNSLIREEGKRSAVSADSLHYHMRSTEFNNDFVHSRDSIELAPLNQIRNAVSESSLIKTVPEHSFR